MKVVENEINHYMMNAMALLRSIQLYLTTPDHSAQYVNLLLKLQRIYAPLDVSSSSLCHGRNRVHSRFALYVNYPILGGFLLSYCYFQFI